MVCIAQDVVLKRLNKKRLKKILKEAVGFIYEASKAQHEGRVRAIAS